MHKLDNSSSYSHIIKYTGLFGGVQMLTIIIAMVRNKFIAMLLGPSGMGLLSLFNSTTKMVSDATGLGIQTSGVRNLSAAFEEENKEKIEHEVRLIRSWSLLTAILGTLLCIVLSPCLNDWTFSWGQHTLHFVLLSPVVGLTALTGGEMAILKGVRHLKPLAVVSVLHAIIALIISIPLYFYLGESGIVPSLVLMAVVMMVLTIYYSWRIFPFRVSFNRLFMREGMGMIRLGIGFVASTLVISFAEFFVRSFLNTQGSLEVLGLYNTGYMITMIYGGMVFAAMETDYFPRLSAEANDRKAANVLVNKQIEVSLLIVSPLLVLLIILLPILVPLLFSGRFMDVVPMVQVTVLALYMRAMKLPLAYIPLAKGDSLFFLLMESLYALGYILLSIVGFNLWGLFGAGVGLTVTIVLDFLIQFVCMHIRYGFKVSKRVLSMAASQLPIGMAAYAITWMGESVTYYLLGLLLTALSAWVSFQSLKKKTRLLNSIKQRFRK